MKININKAEIINEYKARLKSEGKILFGDRNSPDMLLLINGKLYTNTWYKQIRGQDPVEVSVQRANQIIDNLASEAIQRQAKEKELDDFLNN